MGPRKAKYILNQLLSKFGIVFKRNELLVNGLVGENVFNNCAGFIKIDEHINPRTVFKKKSDQYEWLDFTRIHPKHYQIAYKMAKEALDNPSETNNLIIL